MDLRQLANAYAAVTAPAAVLPIAQALAVELGCEPVVIAEADRAGVRGGDRDRDGVLPLDRRAGRRTCCAAPGCRIPASYLSGLAHSTLDHALAAAGSAGAGPLGARRGGRRTGRR